MKKRLTLWITIALLCASIPFAASAGKERKILYWKAPMDPNFRSDKPGKSPMGMDLVPVYADEEDQGSGVTISPTVVQNLGVRVVPVEKGTLARRIDTVGYIDYDESRVAHIHLRVSGWIENLVVESEGDRVRKGQRLFNLYSPELVNAQEEFLRALQGRNRSLIGASRERLKALGINPGTIRQLEKKRKVQQTVAVYAPQDGVVASLQVREGMYVTPSTNVMTLADLSSVWLLAEIFERQAAWVKVGDSARMSLPFLPGKEWQGKVEYIYPSLERKTRTLRARLRFDNPGEVIKPNMYARVVLQASPREGVLSIPLEALIRAGDRDRVIVETGEGRFEAREVVAGIESGDRLEIIEGLSPGDRVVVSGQFLIDSEASLKASFNRMQEPAEPSPSPAGEQPADQPVTAMGVVTALDPEGGSITIEHSEIRELGWGPMTMPFDLDPSVDTRGIEPGDHVMFQLEKRDGSFVITSLMNHGKGM